ncbi:MAG: peroxide stress protein YaaA [Zetaproteobacteria bacterium]|nr:MAG: peroxide stress protein YaaA [Zetaproteobacteria bacterium]
MLALVSPAKKLDFESEWNGDTHTQSNFLGHTQELVNTAKQLSRSQIQSLMKLSDKLGELNYNRYQRFAMPFTTDNAKPAAYAFRGDTYIGLDADTLCTNDMTFAQDHFRILSGLYGLLRPLDLIQPYRLEMGTKITNPRGEDLYDFWGDILTNACNDAVKTHKNNAIISLASNEYIKSIKPKQLNGTFITCHFKEMKDGVPKTIGIFAKRARGMMARYMIQNRLETPEQLQSFNNDGYEFIEGLSDDTDFVFLRDKG